MAEEIIDRKINVAINEEIVFRVRQSKAYLWMHIAVYIGVIVVMYFVLLSSNIFSGVYFGPFSLEQILMILTVIGVSFTIFVLVLDYYTTTYTLTTRRVQKDSGIISRSSLAIPLDEISNLDNRHTLLGRIFNYGDIEVRSDSSETNHIRFRHIAYPQHYREEIEDYQPHGNVVTMLTGNPQDKYMIIDDAVVKQDKPEDK